MESVEDFSSISGSGPVGPVGGESSSLPQIGETVVCNGRVCQVIDMDEDGYQIGEDEWVSLSQMARVGDEVRLNATEDLAVIQSFDKEKGMVTLKVLNNKNEVEGKGFDVHPDGILYEGQPVVYKSEEGWVSGVVTSTGRDPGEIQVNDEYIRMKMLASPEKTVYVDVGEPGEERLIKGKILEISSDDSGKTLVTLQTKEGQLWVSPDQLSSRRPLQEIKATLVTGGMAVKIGATIAGAGAKAGAGRVKGALTSDTAKKIAKAGAGVGAVAGASAAVAGGVAAATLAAGALTLLAAPVLILAAPLILQVGAGVVSNNEEEIGSALRWAWKNLTTDSNESTAATDRAARGVLPQQPERFKGWSKTFHPDQSVSLTKEGKTLSVRKAGITRPPADIDREKLAVVNAANADLDSGRGGTNKVLTDAVSGDTWNASKGGKTGLKPGEVTSGKLEGSNTLQAGVLVQALGPEWGPEYNSPAGMQKAREEMKAAYEGIFRECEAQGMDHVQLPLLSAGNFAPQNDPEATAWQKMTRECLMEASEAALESGKVKSVHLVDHEGVPTLAGVNP